MPTCICTVLGSMPITTLRTAQPVALNLRTYKAAVYESLSKMISELELPPGVRLVESELAARFDVSKTPVREALLLLEADGLVRLAPYYGATVTWLSVDEYKELLFVQDALEQAAIPMVVEGVTKRELDIVGELVERLKRKRREGDSYGFFEVGAQVHERLFTVAHSPRLLRTVMSLILRPTRRYERVFMHQFDETWDQELDIMEGRFEKVRDGDADGAMEHVRQGRVAMLGLISARLQDPLVVPYLAPVDAQRKQRRSTAATDVTATTR